MTFYKDLTAKNLCSIDRLVIWKFSLFDYMKLYENDMNWLICLAYCKKTEDYNSNVKILDAFMSKKELYLAFWTLQLTLWTCCWLVRTDDRFFHNKITYNYFTTVPFFFFFFLGQKKY